MMKKNILIVLVIISLFSLYLFSNKTYTAYESEVDDDVTVDIADWKILIDDQNIATATRDINLSNIVWDSEHTDNNKVAPGSKGTVRINIDPTGTEVAIKYHITYTDHTMDPNCILTVTSIYLENDELQKDSINSYSGIITLDEMKDTQVLVINVEWVNDENSDEADSQIGSNGAEPNYLNLEFEAEQYRGE